MSTVADLERLETRLAYLELSHEQLNESLLVAHRELDILKMRLERAEARLDASPEPGANASGHEPPPHY